MVPFWAISPLVKLLAKLLGQSNGQIVIVIAIGGGEGGDHPPHYIHPWHTAQWTVDSGLMVKCCSAPGEQPAHTNMDRFEMKTE